MLMLQHARRATSQDIEAIIELCRLRSLPLRPLRQATAAARREQSIETYRRFAHQLDDEASEIVCLLSERAGHVDGFLILVLNRHESITGERQAQVHDFAARQPETLRFLLDNAAATARRNGEAYLVVQLDPQATDEEQLFAAAGYTPDMLHICKRVGGPVQTGRETEQSGYTVRESREADRMFVLHLNTLCGPFTIPPHRGTDETDVGQRYLNHYVGLNLDGDPDFKVWIAEHNRLPVGFVMIQKGPPDPVSGEGVGYVYDIAIHPDHQGRLLSQRLVEAAEAWLRENNVALLTGDISAANPRPWRVAEKYLGFSIELRRWAQPL